MQIPPIFDGHNDTLMKLHLAGRESEARFFEWGENGHLDLPRARAGAFGGGFFAVFVPDPNEGLPDKSAALATPDGFEVQMAPPLDQSYALRQTLAMAAVLFRLERASNGDLEVVRSAHDLERCLNDGVVAAVLHLEGAEAIADDFDALEVLYQAGMRSIGLVWSRPNIYGHGVPFKYPHSPDTGPGLSDAGRALVRACNARGIMLDLSHLNEKGFWDVAALSQAPLVATHSNAHAICASARNLTDRQLDAIRDSDGMVGLSFTVSDLREDGHNDAETGLDVMVRQIDYLVERLGVDRVGFGSDFDGTTVPAPIGDVTGLPRLVDALLEHGYGEAELRKLTHANWLRVLRRTWGA